MPGEFVQALDHVTQNAPRNSRPWLRKNLTVGARARDHSLAFHMLHEMARPLVKCRQRGRLVFKAVRLRVRVQFSDPDLRIAPKRVWNLDATIATIKLQQV